MEQTIDQQLAWHVNQLNTEQKQTLLKSLKSMLDHGEESGRISLEDYNHELDAALDEAERGEVVSHEDVVRQSKSW